jgi:lipoyl-dependent peroxiredoxin
MAANDMLHRTMVPTVWSSYQFEGSDVEAPIYSAEALSSGSGRQGTVATNDGYLNLTLAPPRELGGSGQGTNPEQLFAAGFGACFHSALHVAARTQKIPLRESSVGVQVNLHRVPEGFTLSVHLEVLMPGIDPNQASALVRTAEQLCPYSRATRGNIPVEITIAED